jgi:hypothetical protein
VGWLDWRGARARRSSEPVGEAADLSTPAAILQALEKSVPNYLDRVDRGDLIYPACKRMPEDADGDVRAIWEHTRIEAMRYLMMVPGRKNEWLIDPARQPEMLDAFLRKPPHEDTVIDFTGIATEDFAIAIIAGLNWLIHCAALAAVDRKKFSGIQSNFRKITVVARRWWELEGSEPRCQEMLVRGEKPPLTLYLIWLEYTRLAKEIAAAAISRRDVGDRRPELNAALAPVLKTMARLERASDPDDLPGE